MEYDLKLYSVNVQGFSKEFTEERIKELFSKFGDIVDCYFEGPSLNGPLREKARAIVKFETKMEAATAIARLDKQPPFFLSVDWTGAQQGKENYKKPDGRGDRGRLRGSGGSKRYRGYSMDSSRTHNSRESAHPLYVPAARPEPCANCSQEGRLRCSRCKTWYCTVVCQENHWTRHRDRCFAPPPLENPDGSIYLPELDLSNVKIVQNNDEESSSDEVISLQKLSNRGRSGPLNSTLKEDNTTLVADETVLELTEKSPVVQTTLGSGETQVKHAAIKTNQNSALGQKKVEEKSTVQVSNPVLSSSKIRETGDARQNKNLDEFEKISIAANKSQIETSSTEISKKSEEASKVMENETEAKFQNVPGSPSLVLTVPPELVSVSHVVSPSEFYVVPESCRELFETILIEIQEQPSEAPVLELGCTYLARHEGLWYRARLEELSPDGASARVLLIDFGGFEKIPVAEMKQMKVFQEVGGLASRVKMAGIAPKGDSWSEEDIKFFKEFVDEGGETKFYVNILGYDEKEDALVSLVDEEKNDVAQLCVESGVGINVTDTFVDKKKKEDLKSKTEEKKKVALNVEMEETKKKRLVEQEVDNIIEKEVNVKDKTEFGLKFQKPTEVLVTHCASPRDMSVLPWNKVDQWQDLLSNTQNPPQGNVEPKVGKLYLTKHQDLWSRALVQKISPDKSQVKVDLIDFGNLGLKIETSELRKLVVYNKMEGLVERVGLAGLGVAGGKWGNDALEMFKQVVDVGGDTKFVVQSLGEVGGVEMVTMKDGEGNDIRDMCVTLEIAVIVEEVFTPVVKHNLSDEIVQQCQPVNIDAPNSQLKLTNLFSMKQQKNSESMEKTKVQKENITETPQKKIEMGEINVENAKSSEEQRLNPEANTFTPQKKVVEPVEVFPRLQLPVNTPTEVNVTHADNPSRIFVFPTKESEKFIQVFEGCQNPPGGVPDPTVGLVCLAFAEEAWYRAEVKKVFQGKEKVKIYLLDDGKTVEVAVDMLRHMDQFKEVAGLVAEVGLINISCGEEAWSHEALEVMRTVLDVGGETIFTVTSLGKDEEGVDRVRMIDTEGTDVSQFLVEMNVGVKVEHKLKTSTFKDVGLSYLDIKTNKENVNDIFGHPKSTGCENDEWSLEAHCGEDLSKSIRLKSTTAIKPAAPLRSVPSEMSAPSTTKLRTTVTPRKEASSEKPGPSLTSNEKSPTLRPPCAVSILTRLVPGSKLRVMKETKMSLRYFSSICLPEDESTMNYLLDDLQADAAVFRDSSAVSLSPSVGSWVVAWSSSDQIYYRAVILAVVQQDTYTALLIDFAMTQQFDKTDLLDMWPDAARRKALAIQLSAVGDISPEVENLCNAHFEANTTADCVVTEVSAEQITVLITELGVRLTASPWYHCDSKARTLFEECDEIVMMKELRTSKLSEGATVRYCGHGDKICDVYIKRESDEENVKSLMTTLNQAMSGRDNREYREPVIGSIVAVKRSQDERDMFYRASVTSIHKKEKKAKLLLVDYGTRIVEDWTSITWLPEEVRKAPMYAVPVVLANVLSSSIRLGSDLIEKIARDYSEQPLTLKIVSHMAPPVVKLYICGQTKTLNEALHIGEDGAELLSEREKKKLEIAQKMALLEAELANI